MGDAARLRHRGDTTRHVVGQIGRAARLAAGKKPCAQPTIADIVDRGYVIVGSPDEVVEQLPEVAIDLNVGHLMLLLQFGNMGKEAGGLQQRVSSPSG